MLQRDLRLDEGYVAKRMEIGAVIGASPKKNVKREVPQEGDVIILLGGRTGRDGCGGATGSSKSHTLESLEHCGAEVQKGNPPEERKLQRLFRNPDVTKMIKRCNDFGAGGVSVAIGELTDGLVIDLNAVPKKYEGLDGTEIAISESQERMAVVIAKEDVERFLDEAHKENLEATVVADVMEEPRLKMNWNGVTIVDLSREFLNSNGAPKYTDIKIKKPDIKVLNTYTDNPEGWDALMANLNVCSQKGLVEKFDSTIGASTVLMPFGGKYQLTPTQAMAAKIPVLKGQTDTCSIMGWGYNPFISEKSPYHGAMLAVVESIAKVVAAGGKYEHCWLTFQEYFERTQNNPERWGKPMAALLGAFKAQLEMGCGAIGGKDSMSGTFENIDVPPTLVSFAVSTASSRKIVSPEFKDTDSTVIMIKPDYDENSLPVFESVKNCFTYVEDMIENGRAKSVWTVSGGGVAEGIAKMCFGNRIGFAFENRPSEEELFLPHYGSFIIEIDGEALENEIVLGKTKQEYNIFTKSYTLSLDSLQKTWENKLEPVFPCRIKTTLSAVEAYEFNAAKRAFPSIKAAVPKVFIPVFPGTNCEYDSTKAFERAGADVIVKVFKNLSAQGIRESVDEFEKAINQSQIIMFPGGFSAGDEPDGSAKFFATAFRNAKMKEAVERLLNERDGLALGICNGFQALIKLGLVPNGSITGQNDQSPTLTFNTINRHISKMVYTKVVSNKSPWLAKAELGGVYTNPASHGEGRFVAPKEWLDKLFENGQVATQYCDPEGNVSMDEEWNVNGSYMAIEGITSPDGRCLGKMAHSERRGDSVAINIYGEQDIKIFESGVKYFK